MSLQFVPFRFLPIAMALGLLALLTACPPPTGDDDDSSDPDPPVGDAPVITDVTLCEVPALTDCEEPRFGVRFQVTATDADDDMNNPWWALLIEGNNPMDGFLEDHLASGGTLNLNICGEWTRGADLAFEVWIKDAEDNESNRWEDTWVVPLEEGDDDCSNDDFPGR